MQHVPATDTGWEAGHGAFKINSCVGLSNGHGAVDEVRSRVSWVTVRVRIPIGMCKYAYKEDEFGCTFALCGFRLD